MSTAAVLSIAMVLDALLGEPKWLWDRVPHPAVLMGRVIGWCDARFNQGTHRKINGVIVLIVLICGAGALGHGLSVFGPIAEALVGGVLLAQRSLVAHVQAVARDLRLSLAAGRRAVAMIVSRDTAAMDAPAVTRATIESAAENLSDGVIAPAFWFLVLGLPGLLIYKTVNTADSMIGYRSETYRAFGWAAARFDDVLNWVPARLTALLLVRRAGGMKTWAGIRADAQLHRSPNAGWPEAAMSRAIDVALAGPRAYDGTMQDFAWVNAQGERSIGPPHIDAAIARLWHAWRVALGMILIFHFITS